MAVDDRVETILARLGELEQERSPWETTWREVDQRINPLGDGGFAARTPGNVRGLDIYDHTASLGLDRFTAAYTGMIIPRGERYHQLATTDAALNDVPAVQRWLEHANDRLFAMRYAPSAGFNTESGMNIRSLGSYGSGPMWVDRWRGRGLYYKCLHMSECFVDEDFRGRIDTIYRKFSLSVRQAAQMFGIEHLPRQIAQAYGRKHLSSMFDFVHVVRPREDQDPKRLDFRRLAFESIYVAIADRTIIREGGYSSQPMAFSRYATGPREKYGRSPAMQVLGTIRTANEIARTLLKSAHKAVDPPLLVPEDGVLTRIRTAPGGVNPGGLDIGGRAMVVPLQTGGNLPIGMEMLNNEREVVRDAFLEKVWSLVTERRDRMTATEVLELARLQGMMLAPMASRQETEWLGVQIERELDIGLEDGFIDPPPPVMAEASARIRVVYDNPLSRAAKAEEAIGFSRLIETLVPIASVDPSVFDVIDTAQAPRELARALGVRTRYLADPDTVDSKRKQREEQQAAQTALQILPKAAGAARDLAAARSEETAYV